MQFPSELKGFEVNFGFPKLKTCFQWNVCFQINNHVSKFIVFSTFSSKFFFFKLIFEIFVQFLLWFHLLWTNSTKNVAKNLFENSIPLPIFFSDFPTSFSSSASLLSILSKPKNHFFRILTMECQFDMWLIKSFAFQWSSVTLKNI